MPCSRMPKCRVRPYQSPGKDFVEYSGGTNDGPNRNQHFHRPFSGFPQGTELAARLVELFSLLCATVTVACAVLLARLYKPLRPGLWVAAGALMAALPGFDYQASVVNNDALAIALADAKTAFIALGRL